MPNSNSVSIDEIHAFLKKSIIEAYLKGKGYTINDLKDLPEYESKHLKAEASTYASSQLAEAELQAHVVHELYEAYREN
ncbi:MAG: hypothetical protein JW730_07705 [Anaerolineales bacterium]|nr:hypothetical protein [Anaerolineales bacterium]